MATPIYGPFGLGLEYCAYKRLPREVLVDIDTTIQWCKRNGLLARSQECNACSIPMHWEVYDRRLLVWVVCMHAWYIFMHECMKAGVHVRFCEKKHDLNVYISLHLSRS